MPTPMDTETVHEETRDPLPPGPRFTAASRVWVIRALLFAGAFACVWGSDGMWEAFRRHVAADVSWGPGSWYTSALLLVLAGALFTAAVRLPFPAEGGYAWGWLGFAVVAASPVLHMSVLLWITSHHWSAPMLIQQYRWFDGDSTTAACAVFVGVAIVSGVRAARRA